MGKVKRKKNKIQRTNPTADSSSSAELMEEVQRNGENSAAEISPYVETILTQLKSPSMEERDSAINSLSQACSDPGLLDQFLRHDVVKTAFTLIGDKSRIVRHSVTGALRNISTVGTSICSLMISQGIMPPLVELLKENYTSWKPQQKTYPTSPLQIDTLTETFVEAVNLMLNLCESSETALKAFNESGLFEIFIPCLNVADYGLRVAIAVGQCLHTVTEDNKESIPHFEAFETLLQKILGTEISEKLVQADQLYLKTLAGGILLNMENPVMLPTPVIPQIMNTISEMLSIDHKERLKQFSSEIPLQNPQDAMVTDQLQVNETPTTEKQIACLEISSANINNLLRGQMLALEVLSNLLFPDEDEELDSEDGSEEETMEVEDMESQDEKMDDFSLTASIPEVHEAIVSKKLLDVVLTKISDLPVNVSQILSENQEFGKGVLKTLRHLRARALLCFQNLVCILDEKDLGNQTPMLVWVALFQQLKEESVQDVSDGELLEAITSAQRALTTKWTESKTVGAELNIPPSDLNVIGDLYKRVSITKTQANIIKIIGGIGVLITKRQNIKDDEQLIEQIGEFLLSCISSFGDSNHLWRVSEALDTIFDVFAEDDFNHVLKKLGMIDKLKVFLPQFKKNIYQQRRLLGDHKAIIETSRANLSRFIEYKVQNGCK